MRHTPFAPIPVRAAALALVLPALACAQTSAAQQRSPAAVSAPAAAAAVAAAPAAAAAAPAGATPTFGSGVKTRTFPNGLQVIVWPDHDNPSVALYTWFRVGSRNERPGITGLSHFFEHMMFNGAKRYGPGEFDRVMEAAGGRNNAYTSNDVTVYQDWFPRTALTTIFDLEHDRLCCLAIDPKVVESERGVVYSERRSGVDNNTAGLLYEQLQATAFVAHPYQFPTIGWPSDIEKWSQKDLEDYFRTYYAPNNAVLIASGDVTPEEIYAQVERTLARIPKQPAPEPVRTVEPPQLGERRLTVRKEAQAPMLMASFHAPAEKDPKMPALELLGRVLGDGDSSRLHRKLVEEAQVALRVSVMVDQGFDPGLFTVHVELPPGGDAARAEALLHEELARAAAGGVSDAELKKARNQVLADFWRRLETVSGRAQLLGHYAVFHGDWKKLQSAPAAYERVTRDAVQAVAREVLRAENRTVAVLQPESAAPAPAAPKASK